MYNPVCVFITRWGCVGGHYRCIILCVYHQVGLREWTLQVYNPMCLLPGGSEWRDIEPLQHRPQVLFHQQRRQPHRLQLLQRHVSPPVSPPVHWEKEAFYQRLKDRNDVARSGTGPHSVWDGTTFRVGRYYVQGGDGTTFRVITVLHSGWDGTTFRVGTVLHSG